MEKVHNLDDLKPDERMLLMRYICAFVWADESLAEEEFRLLGHLVKRLGLDEGERSQVMNWIESPDTIGKLDTESVPDHLKQVFVDAAKLVIVSDGNVDEDEAALLAKLQVALGTTAS